MKRVEISVELAFKLHQKRKKKKKKTANANASMQTNFITLQYFQYPIIA